MSDVLYYCANCITAEATHVAIDEVAWDIVAYQRRATRVEKTYLCTQCKNAYAWGQSRHEAEVIPIEEDTDV